MSLTKRLLAAGFLMGSMLTGAILITPDVGVGIHAHTQ